MPRKAKDSGTKSPKSKRLAPEKMARAAQMFYKEVGPKVVTASKIKQFYASMGLRVDSQLVEALAKDFTKTMLGAAKRCVGNKRGTVRPMDL